MAYGEDPLWVALGPHVGVMNLLQDHPRLVVFTVLAKDNDNHNINRKNIPC